MKPVTLLASSLLVATASAQLIPFFTKPRLAAQNQQPMDPNMANPGIALPPSSDSSNPTTPSNGPPPNSNLCLNDVLGSQKQINIFAGFTRDVSSVSDRLDNTSMNTTILAPLNSAIASLSRKPWEDPEDYSAFGTSAYQGQAGEDRASGNLRRFTEAHVVPASPWKAGEKWNSVGGNEVWWEVKDGVTMVMPGSVEVEKVASRVANGEVWVLKGVLNYARKNE